MIHLVYEPLTRSQSRGVVRLIAVPTESPVLRMSALVMTPGLVEMPSSGVHVERLPKPRRGNRKGQERRAKQAREAFEATHRVWADQPIPTVYLHARQMGDRQGWQCRVYATREEWSHSEDAITEAVNEWLRSREAAPHQRELYEPMRKSHYGF